MKLRKLLGLLLAITMLFGLSTTSFAHDSTADDDAEVSQPRYIISCPGGGKHYMESKGWVDVFNGIYPGGTLKWSYAPGYQCSYCYVVIVTESLVSNYAPIGAYAEWQLDYQLQGPLSKLWTNRFYYEPSKTLSGYEFH